MTVLPPTELPPPRLDMKGVGKRFGATAALTDVDLAVEPGEVHALIGENGAGKSTLMKILSGAVKPDSGEMRLDGETYRPQNPADARRRGVAMIYQELSLAPHLSVEENILLGMEPTVCGVVRRGELRARARAAIEKLGRTDIEPGAPVHSLSIAQRQIVEIARAIAVGCRVLVLDEPTSSLTHRDVERLFELVANLKAAGHAVVYISHFLEEIFTVADRFTVLRDGKVAGRGALGDVSMEQIVRMMAGGQSIGQVDRSTRSAGEPMLQVEHLSGTSGRPADATLTLHRGEVLGIAGLIGAGRTELLRTIFGLQPLGSGRLQIMKSGGWATPRQRWRQGVGIVCEDRKTEGLALELSIAENITLSDQRRLGPLGLVFPNQRRRAAAEWIDRLGVRCQSGSQPVGHLSGGNQQKVAIARLLFHDVDVFLLDEPTRGIDVMSKSQIYRLVDQLAAGSDGRRPRGIVIVSSYLPELLATCDRIAVMRRGVLGPARPVAQLDEHKLLLEATGVGDAV